MKDRVDRMRTGNRNRGWIGGTSAWFGLCKIGLLIGFLGWPAPLRSGSPKTVGESPSGARLLSVRLLPEEVRLRGKGAAQQLLVIGTYADGLERDLTAKSRFSIADPALAEIDAEGRVRARSDGRTLLTVQSPGPVLRAVVQVRDSALTPPLRFDRDIARILTKRGCNSTECHGRVTGEGGFKLSKNATAPREDYRWIVEGGTFHVLTAETGEKAPRIRLEDPAQSLLLLKASLAVPHGGGKRLEEDSGDYRRLLDWIGGGALYGPEDGARSVPLERVAVTPGQVVLQKGGGRQLLVTAHWADGVREDITRQVRYLSNNPEVVSVGSDGRLRGRQVGETAIQVLAGGQSASATVGVIEEPVVAYPVAPRRNFVDEHVFAKARKFHLIPSPLSSDAEFLRRLCLDLTGRLPPVHRVRQFLADPDPEKRTRLIDLLLKSPEFVDHWSWRFYDFLRVIHPVYKQWVRQAIAENKPYDQFARERVAAQGFDGPTRHYEDMGGTAVPLPQNAMGEQVRVFLGRRMDCAQCHDHPYETWSQDQFWGLTAFFGRLSNLHPGHPQVDFVIMDDPEGYGTFGKGAKVIHPRSKQEVQPRFLDGKPVPQDRRDDWRLALAEWMTSPENPYFAPAMVNRMWGYFFGRGIVDPVDDFRSNNLATHPQLLEALAQHFVRSGYDLRSLMRLMVESRTYQLSGDANPTNRYDRVNYSRALPRPLETELLLRAISHVSGVKGEDGNFFNVYGKPDLSSIPERNMRPNLLQALHQLAGPTFTAKLSGKGGRVDRLLQSQASDEAIIEELYLAALCRFPTENEQAGLKAGIRRRDSRREAIEDLLWALVNSEQFLNNL